MTELLRHEMNNTTIQEMQSDIEELFDNEGERPCYLSDETHSETVNGAKNSDLEADNAAKLSDLDVSGNTQQDSTHDLSKGSSAPKRMVEEGEPQFWVLRGSCIPYFGECLQPVASRKIFRVLKRLH